MRAHTIRRMAGRSASRVLCMAAVTVGSAFGSTSAVAAAEPPVPQATPAEARACAAACGRVLVEARAAGDRTAVPAAAIVITPAPADAEPGPAPVGSPPPTPWLREQRTDEQGSARFDAVAATVVRIAIVAPGFEANAEYVRVVADATVQVRLFARPTDNSPFRTVVAAQPVPRAQVSEHRLTREEIATLPGSQGDPLRALQNLPGVTRPPLGLGLLVIRGSAPGQSRVYLGGHAMPRAFHILSLASVFPADVLDELQFVPGNFDAAYGGATGGIVVVEPRRGRRDGVHGFGEIDLAAASAMVEGPLGKGSFIVAAQRAYVDAVLATGATVSERVTEEPVSVLLPRYFDYQVFIDQPLRSGSFGVRVLGSGDVLRARPSPELATNSSFRYRSDFHRADVVVRKRWAGWTMRLTPSFRYELARLVAGNNALRRTRQDFIGSARAELAHAVGPRVDLTVGTDFELDGFFTEDDIATIPGLDTNELRSFERTRGFAASVGVYASAEVRLGRLTLRPGARLSSFSVGRRFAYSIEPRAVAEVELAPRWQLAAGLGRHAQSRSVADSNDIDLVGQTSGVAGATALLPGAFAAFDPSVSFGPGDTQLNVRESLQASASIRWRLSDRDSAELTGFWWEQHNNVPPVVNGVPNPFDSVSRSVGLEALVRRRVTSKLYGWVGYTLLFADLILRQRRPGFPYRRRPSDYDQRHNLVALLSYALPKHWRIGARFRLVSGLPYTPAVGSIAYPGAHLPLFGNRNTARLPLSHQLDVRLDKQWFRDRSTVTAYIDIQNVYNRVNPEITLYSADFRREAGFVGLPIFPSLGVRVAW